jgi:hypothetical protein
MPLSVWVVAAGLPLLVGLVAVAVQLAWLPELPDPVATHWGADGADGFGPAWATTVFTAGVTIGIVGLFATILLGARGPAPTAIHKVLAVSSFAVSVVLCGTMTASVGIQRGLDDAADAPDITPWVIGSLLVGLGAAVIAWVLLPKSVAVATELSPAEPLRLAPGERSVWIAETRLSGRAVAVILLAVGFAIAATAFAIVVSDGLVWPLVFIPVLLVLLCASGISWSVRVDPTGLTVRSQPFGWPRTRIAASDIASVDTSHVEPLAEFGGWGWRWAPGRNFGVISRGGEAIEVTRLDGRRFTVTVDDAATGAALLAAYSGAAR